MGPERIFFFSFNKKMFLFFLKISKKKKYNSEDEPLSINNPFFGFLYLPPLLRVRYFGSHSHSQVMVAEPKTRLLGPSNDKSYTESNSYLFYAVKEPEKAPALNRSAPIKAPRR